jgi:CRP/FNR family transcriptional regulator, dissimilatory nitrate respiration regulator
MTAKQLSPLLDGVEPRTARRLTAAAKTLQLRRRDFIFKAGEPSSGLYIVLSGRVKLSLPLTKTEERVLEILEPGAWFGESALVIGQAHAGNASALEPTTLAQIPAAPVLQSLRQDRVFATKILTGAVERLQSALFDTAATRISARERVVHWILDAARTKRLNDRAEIVVPATKRVLASHLNITAAHLSRMFQELKEAKLIEVKGRRISVPSVSRLEAECAIDGSSRV